MIATAFAPAKVNLYLHVGRPLPDGLHPLDSLAAFAADVGDWVSAGPSGALSLDITGPFAEGLTDATSDNLVLKAARALADAGGVPAYASLHLEKALPIASGLGGGSADAAAALRLLNELWALGAADDDLERLAAGLGADVAACVRSRTCRMSGTGSEVDAAPMPPVWCVLANPLAPSPTGAVYRAFDELGLGHAFRPDLPYATDLRDSRALLNWLQTASRNDLERPALRETPLIGRVLERLRGLAPPSAVVRLSGSGATCFALVESAADAVQLSETLQAEQPQWWVRATPLGDVDVAPTGSS